MLKKFFSNPRAEQDCANENTLNTLRDVVLADKRAFASHPIVREVIARYEDMLMNTQASGLPRAPVEPVAVFRERMNELTVASLEKRFIRKKKLENREKSKRIEQQDKERGQRQYNNSFRPKRAARPANRYP